MKRKFIWVILVIFWVTWVDRSCLFLWVNFGFDLFSTTLNCNIRVGFWAYPFLSALVFWVVYHNAMSSTGYNCCINYFSRCSLKGKIICEFRESSMTSILNAVAFGLFGYKNKLMKWITYLEFAAFIFLVSNVVINNLINLMLKWSTGYMYCLGLLLLLKLTTEVLCVLDYWSTKWGRGFSTPTAVRVSFLTMLVSI